MPATPIDEMQHFFDIAFTPSVVERQRASGSFEHYGATDWNCPKHITQRYSVDEVRALTSH